MGTDDDRKILDILMDDSPWQQKDIVKKPLGRKQTIEDKKETEGNINLEQKSHIKPVRYEKKDEPVAHEKAFGEVDYAVLKSVSYEIKTIPQISKALQIRANVVEKHIFNLIKDGYLKYFQFCVLTTHGKNAIEEYEHSKPEDIWMPIDNFIVTIIKRKKENNLKIQKLIDIVLLVSIIILIILIIYFGVLS